MGTDEPPKLEPLLADEPPSRGATVAVVAAAAAGALLLAGAGVYFASARLDGRRGTSEPEPVVVAPVEPEPGPRVEPVARVEPEPSSGGPRVLTTEGEGRYALASPADLRARDARLVLENGGAAPVAFELDGGAGRVEVAPGARAVVALAAGRVRLAAGGATETADVAAGSTVVYDPSAAWDYVVVTRSYSSFAFGGGDGERRVVAPVLFDAGAVDALFEELPESVTVQTYGGYGSATRRGLRHASEAPDRGRVVRRVATASGGELRVVDLGEDGEGGISVQRASSAAAPDARVYVDAATDAVALALDGAEVGGVPAGEQRSLYLPAGAWRLGARRGGVESAVARELAAGRRYAWTPGAGRAYAIDYERYGPAFLGDKGETPTPRSARGLELFEVRTDFAFEPFPDQVRTAFGTATTRSRLGLGAVAPREEVVAGYDALLARAKEALSEDALAALEVRLPKVDRATLSDLDLGLAEGLLDEALGDREAAEDRYTDAIAFAPDDARLLSLRGRVRSALGRIDGAREDLEAAVAKDPSLEAALAPAIAEAKAAIERREAAQRKAAEDAAAAEKRELRDEARRRVDAVPEDTSDLEARARKALPAEVIATFLDLLHGRKAGGDGPRAEARLLTLGGALGLLEPEARAPTDFYAAAIDADASYADVHALQAAEWISLNDEDAARELETASRLAPEKAEAWRPLLERERAKAEERRKLLEPPKEEGGE